MQIVTNLPITSQCVSTATSQRPSETPLNHKGQKASKKLEGTLPTYLCRCLDDPKKRKLDERKKLASGHRELLKVLIMAGAHGDSACWKSIKSIAHTFDLATRDSEDPAKTCKKKIRAMLKDLVMWQYIVFHNRTDRSGRDISPLILILDASGLPFEWNRKKLLAKTILVREPNRGKRGSKNQRRLTRQKEKKEQKESISPALRGGISPPNTYPLKGDMCISNNSVLRLVELNELPKPVVDLKKEKRPDPKATTKTTWGWRLIKLGVKPENVALIELREAKTPLEKILKALDYIADKKIVSAGAYFTKALKEGWELATPPKTEEDEEQLKLEKSKRRLILRSAMEEIFKKYEHSECISVIFSSHDVSVKNWAKNRCTPIPLDSKQRIGEFDKLCERICAT